MRKLQRISLNGIVAACLKTSLLISSCSPQTHFKYHADWIVTRLEIGGKDSLNMLALYNLTLDHNRNLASGLDIYVGEEIYLIEDAPFRIWSSEQGDSISFRSHPLLSGQYGIRCRDRNCCELAIENDRISLQFRYNGDIPYGRSRDCE